MIIFVCIFDAVSAVKADSDSRTVQFECLNGSCLNEQLVYSSAFSKNV